jgi:hypothetical protein
MAIGIKWCPLYLWVLTMALSFAIACVDQLMTLEAIVSRVKSMTTTLTMKILGHVEINSNETLDIKVYHRSFHIACPLSLASAYMMFQMVSCLAIC